MADFEDANSPTWRNMVYGHVNLLDAIDGTITYDGSDGRHYELVDDPATLLVRPRGWHLPERHLAGRRRAGAPARWSTSASSSSTAPRGWSPSGSGPTSTCRSSSHHLEARLWNDVFCFAEDSLGIAARHVPRHGPDRDAARRLRDGGDPLRAARALRGTERRPLGLHLLGDQVLPASAPTRCCPTAATVTMTVPFMRAYTELLAATCHRRGALAMGGMAALIPSPHRPGGQRAGDRRACAPTRSARSAQGYDGTWVAHPDLVGVGARGLRRGAWRRAQPDRAPARRRRRRRRRSCSTWRRRPARSPRPACGPNVSVGFQYISFWLGGRGAAAINNLMEDAATAEISRSQIWQWVHHGARSTDGRVDHRELVRAVLDEETAEDPRRGRRGDLGGRAAGGDPRDLRAGRAVGRARSSSSRSRPTSTWTEPDGPPVNLDDYERLAAARLEPGAFGYFAGGAGDERTVAGNRAAFARWALCPRVLVDVGAVGPETRVLGGAGRAPGARGADRVPARRPPGRRGGGRPGGGGRGDGLLPLDAGHDLAGRGRAAAPGGRRWFQLYCYRDRGITRSLVEQAAAAGFEAIVLTVDMPVLGRRERESPDGLRGAGRARRAELPDSRRRPAVGDPGRDGRHARPDGQLARPRAARWGRRGCRPGQGDPRGAGRPAGRAVRRGGDRRVQPRGPAARRRPRVVDALPGVVEAVDGAVPVIVDGGVRRGTDVIVALALGAEAVMVGRPVVWGLAARGEPGVADVLALLGEEVRVALALLGCPTPADVGRGHVVRAV